MNNKFFKIILNLAVIGLLALGYLSSKTHKEAKEPFYRVLFLGNSYTYENDLPKMYAALAQSGELKVETEMLANAGWFLSNHANSPDTLKKLSSSKWDFVVLQEQSQTPASEFGRTQVMYPAARKLVSQIRSANANPIFFMTWAHKKGFPGVGEPDYFSMQTQIEQGYSNIAHELNVQVAPVGIAWSNVAKQHPELNLWDKDGIHPNVQGTYLAACVFYAAIHHKSPVGLSYTADISKEVAYILQVIASDAVLKV